MKIGITAEWVGAQAGGPERYTVELIDALAATSLAHEITVFHCDSAPRAWLDSLPHSWARRRIGATRKRAIPIGLPLELARHPLDLCHATYFMPPVTPGRFVLSILDVGFESNPEYFPWAVRQRLSKLTAWGARRARHIITLSEHAKQQIMNCYGLAAEQITVTPLAASGRFSATPDADDAAVRARFGLPREYLLYVGKIQERKNIPRLLRAYHLLREEMPDTPKLALVGDPTWKSEASFAMLAELGLREHVVLSGHTRDEDLPALYRGARLFVYPSLLEGFGLPPLEAMASGVPVACSHASSLPEVVGDAAVLFDPFSVTGIADAMRSILADDALRSDLIERGRQQARNFSWQATARATLGAYERAQRS